MGRQEGRVDLSLEFLGKTQERSRRLERRSDDGKKVTAAPFPTKVGQTFPFLFVLFAVFILLPSLTSKKSVSRRLLFPALLYLLEQRRKLLLLRFA